MPWSKLRRLGKYIVVQIYCPGFAESLHQESKKLEPSSLLYIERCWLKESDPKFKVYTVVNCGIRTIEIPYSP